MLRLTALLILAVPICTAATEIHPLPPHQVLRYAVLYGDDGFKLGTTTYTWKVADGRYSLTSVAQASGLAALVMNGNVVNSSEGRITHSGLLPEHFWISRKNERREFANFDWPGKRLELPEGRVEALPAQTQDLVSFIYQLAMTAGEEGSVWKLPVTNGKNLKDYRFQVIGVERREVMGKMVDTWHIQGTRPNEGDTDVWLDMNRLPVRIRNVDTKGKAIVQNLLQIQP